MQRILGHVSISTTQVYRERMVERLTIVSPCDGDEQEIAIEPEARGESASSASYRIRPIAMTTGRDVRLARF